MSMPDLGVGADLNGGIAFSTESEWNMRVDFTPLARHSAQIIREISPTRGLHADFGSGEWDGELIGIPYLVVDEGQSLTEFLCTLWPDESDEGPFPIPGNAPIEGGGDHHVIVVQRDSSAPNGLGMLYEIYDAHFDGTQWTGQAAIFDLQGGDHQRPDGWTSADAAGLPIFPGLARYDEMARAIATEGTLGHALRFTLSQALTAMKAVGAASHWADNIDGPAAFGMHVRLRNDFHIPDDAAPETRVIINTLKQYGLILADNGSDWYISGTPDERWDNEALHTLSRIKGGDFEVVDNKKIGVIYAGYAGDDVIDANDGDNRINGNGGDDTINAAAGDDRLTGWRGNDNLTGGADTDTFVFASVGGSARQSRQFGSDVITDFSQADGDIIEIDRSFGLRNFGVLMNHAEDVDGEVVITFGKHASITIAGVTTDELVKGDFHFV